MVGSAQRWVSISCRCSRDRNRVSRASRVARHSEIRPSFQGGQGVGHLAGQDLGQAQVPPTLVGGFLAGQGDLPGDPAALAFGGDPTGGVRGADRFVEVGGDPGLGGRGGGFELFEGAELVDPFGVGDIALEGGELVDPAGDNDGIYCRTQFVVTGRTRLGIRR